MKTVIWAGGLGTRLAEETDVTPKPMVEIGGRPILWHVMQIYARHGHREFAVALGHKAEVVKRYFLDYHYLRNDISVHLGNGRVDIHDGHGEDWIVHLVDTGADTATGGRLLRLAPRLRDGTFMATYGDGVADIDLDALLAFHRDHGKLATVTAVRPPARFGGLTLEDEVVSAYEEKPQIGEGWVSGGFYVLEPEVLDHIDDLDTAFELEPVQRLAKEGQLMAYRHEGFWQPMDTLRDVRVLQRLWKQGDAPWMR